MPSLRREHDVRGGGRLCKNVHIATALDVVSNARVLVSLVTQNQMTPMPEIAGSAKEKLTAPGAKVRESNTVNHGSRSIPLRVASSNVELPGGAELAVIFRIICHPPASDFRRYHRNEPGTARTGQIIPKEVGQIIQKVWCSSPARLISDNVLYPLQVPRASLY